MPEIKLDDYEDAKDEEQEQEQIQAHEDKQDEEVDHFPGITKQSNVQL